LGNAACRESTGAALLVGTGILLRNGVGLIVAGFAAFAISFGSYMWLTLDAETANVGARADARDPSASGPHFLGPDLASLQTGDISEFAFKQLDNWSNPPPSHSRFGERFSFDQASAPGSFAQPSHLSTSFDDRFGADALAPSTTVRSAAAAPRAAAPHVAAIPVARPAPRSGIAQAAPKRSSGPGFQLASASDTSVSLAYAPSDPAKGAATTGSALKDLTPKDLDPSADIDTSRTAIYDITSRTVYLPNGRRLEAHSGLGDQMDDPRHVTAKNTGPTPPNVYELKLRESRFHGVRAIRLVPTDSTKMYGRDGILAHSYLLGPNGQSNGCVSFKDYAAFLDAFDRGEVNRLVVVERLAGAPPAAKTASDWLSNTLKDIFRRS
jgi:hypothetical protein